MKVIFLDIDGPMIPGTMILVNRRASWERQFPVTTIAAVNSICERSGAKIVFNTTHNTAMPEVPDIEVALVEQGLKPEHLHPSDLKTKYPALRRDEAVKEWLLRHPDTEEWVALDDSRFTEDDNLIWIDPDAGIHLGHVNQAIEKLGGRPFLIFM